MKRRTRIGALALLVVIGLMLWLFLRGHRATITTELLPSEGSAGGAPTLTLQVKTQRAGAETPPAARDSALRQHSQDVVRNESAIEGAEVKRQVAPMVTPGGAEGNDDDAVRAAPVFRAYTARVGDSVSKLAADQMGGDTKANRNAIIHANPSLRQDPNKVIAGQMYLIPVSSDDASQSARNAQE